MGMGFAPTWLRHVSPPPLLHKTISTTEYNAIKVGCAIQSSLLFGLRTYSVVVEARNCPSKPLSLVIMQYVQKQKSLLGSLAEFTVPLIIGVGTQMAPNHRRRNAVSACYALLWPLVFRSIWTQGFQTFWDPIFQCLCGRPNGNLPLFLSCQIL